MKLFGFRKNKEEKKVADCGCSCGYEVIDAGAAETADAVNDCLSESAEGICCIKVLGAGCKSCHEQYEYAKDAVKAMGLSVDVEYITDMRTVMKYGVMNMPALVVNEKVVSSGKVLKAANVEKLLRKLEI